MSTVLLIEPDRPLAKTYSGALKSAGYKVSVVSSAQQAIHGADQLTPDVVVLELQLVGHSGIEFLYEFRSYADWQNIPVLVHTAVPYIELQDGWGLLTKHLGVSDYKYKPTTDLQTLVSSVNELALR